LGPISVAAVSNARTGMLRRMVTDPDLGKRVERIARALGKETA